MLVAVLGECLVASVAVKLNGGRSNSVGLQRDDNNQVKKNILYHKIHKTSMNRTSMIEVRNRYGDVPMNHSSQDSTPLQLNRWHIYSTIFN